MLAQTQTGFSRLVATSEKVRTTSHAAMTQLRLLRGPWLTRGELADDGARWTQAAATAARSATGTRAMARRRVVAWRLMRLRA